MPPTPPPSEPNATGAAPLGNLGGVQQGAVGKVAAGLDVKMSGLEEGAAKANKFVSAISALAQGLSKAAESGGAKKYALQLNEIAAAADKAAKASSAANKVFSARPGDRPSNWGSAGSGPSAGTSLGGAVPPRMPPPVSFGGGGGSGDGGGGSGGGGGRGGNTSSVNTGSFRGTSADNGAMAPVADKLGGMADLLSPPTNVIGAVQNAIGAVKSVQELYGALTQAGMQYAYNRIEGPTGNRNAMMTMSQALSGVSTMSGIKTHDLATGFAQRTPIQGSFTDIIQATLAGQSVGAQLSGTSNRNGFFEAAREMQTLTPGVSGGKIAGTLAGYVGNTRSQQMGVYMGGGAFTMVGKGGSYKSLGEWADGITKFFKEQRPGADRGKPFTRAELLAQNFPGSNINAWFMQMGIPQDMVDYWWQYIMTKVTAGAGDDGPFDLKDAVKKQRGVDLGAERLRNVTQSSRREFALGTQMYNQYGMREASDRRFNTVMTQTDLALGQMMQSSNVGTAMGLLPTPIAELLMPILTRYASSPAGSIATGIGHLLGDVPIGDPIGDTPRGVTSTRGMAPDLAKKVNAMMRANPRLKVSSGYRDTVTQNRLQRQGVGRVGPASKSAHTRGWAADLGPTSELGWLQQNAGKFGLQTASNYGEPWHVQHAGSMHVGDPAPIGDFWDTAKSMGTAIAGGINPGLGAAAQLAFGVGLPGMATGALEGSVDFFQNLIKKFVGGGNMSDMIDAAINLYGKAMTFPLAGLTKLFGTSAYGEQLGIGNDHQVQNLIDRNSAIQVDISSWGGFTPNMSNTNGPQIFGDPIGDIGQRMARAGGGGGTIFLFQNQFSIGQGGTSTAADTRRTVTAIGDQLESDMKRRMAKVTG